jgi:ankyrin repeat protein
MLANDICNRRNNYPLHYAVATGDESAIEQLLRSRSADIDESDGRDTPLLLAIERGQTSVVELLLRLGADVDRPGHPNGATPLSSACSSQGMSNGVGLEVRRPIVRHLLSYGANVRASDASSPLFTILKAPHKYLVDEVVSLLLENGVEVNPADESSRTPLHFASLKFLTFSVGALLKSGASPRLWCRYQCNR